MDYAEYDQPFTGGKVYAIQLLPNADRSLLHTENETGSRDPTDEVIPGANFEK